MSTNFNRAIGLTREKEIEEACGVMDLHIGWHLETDQQDQVGPDGEHYRAPLVSWVINDNRQTFVPVLQFVENTDKLAWIKELLSIDFDPQYTIDVQQLEQDIKAQLNQKR
ncbi:MAG: hypothetical protein ACX936_07670 [Marinobacter sp.]